MIGFLIQLVVTIFIPAYCLYAIVRKPYPTAVLKYLVLACNGLIIFVLFLYARWDMTSYYLRYFWLAALVVAVAVAIFRPVSDSAAAQNKNRTSSTIMGAIGVVLLLGAAGYILNASRAPTGTVDMASPLRDGTSYVGHGGSSPLINYHNVTRSQKYAMDIGGINQFGYEPSFSSNLNDYSIFGRTIYSPCNGKVEETVKGLSDNIPPKTDKKNIAGNHVVIECKNVKVELAHMKKDSVKVKAGQSVTTKTKLGEVGNTGNTTQPHLHIHAVHKNEAPLKGHGVPISINGKFLVRNDVF